MLFKNRKLSTAFLLPLAAVLALTLASCASGETARSSGGSSSQVLTLDYAYWNPLSLVIRDQGWLEEELADQQYQVEWVLSGGSNVALENLNAEAIDIGSSAGSAAFAAHANGVAITMVGVFSQPNWATLVVGKDSEISSVEQLKGKRVAATSGTDPYFFLLQALAEIGLSTADVEVVNLPHAEGQKALENGNVDAWAGLDPLTATSELTAGSKIIYSNPSFNSWGVISATNRFIADKPEILELVLTQYERARAWILENPQAAVDILAREAQLEQSVAKKVLTERTKIDVSIIPGESQLAVFRVIMPVLVNEARIKSAEDAEKSLETLIDDSFARKIG